MPLESRRKFFHQVRCGSETDQESRDRRFTNLCPSPRLDTSYSGRLLFQSRIDENHSVVLWLRYRRCTQRVRGSPKAGRELSLGFLPVPTDQSTCAGMLSIYSSRFLCLFPHCSHNRSSQLTSPLRLFESAGYDLSMSDASLFAAIRTMVVCISEELILNS